MGEVGNSPLVDMCEYRGTNMHIFIGDSTPTLLMAIRGANLEFQGSRCVQSFVGRAAIESTGDGWRGIFSDSATFHCGGAHNADWCGSSFEDDPFACSTPRFQGKWAGTEN